MIKQLLKETTELQNLTLMKGEKVINSREGNRLTF